MTALMINKLEAQYLITIEVAEYLKEQHELACGEMMEEMFDLGIEYRRALENAYYNVKTALSSMIDTERFIKAIRHELEAEELYVNTEDEESLFVERFENLANAIREQSAEI